jgi:hypothetical protein
LAKPLLNEKHRTWGIKPDRQRGQQKERCADHCKQTGKDDVDASLQPITAHAPPEYVQKVMNQLNVLAGAFFSRRKSRQMRHSTKRNAVQGHLDDRKELFPSKEIDLVADDQERPCSAVILIPRGTVIVMDRPAGFRSIDRKAGLEHRCGALSKEFNDMRCFLVRNMACHGPAPVHLSFVSIVHCLFAEFFVSIFGKLI